MSPFLYAVDTDALGEPLSHAWETWQTDDELAVFIKDCTHNPHTSMQHILLPILSFFVPDYEAHGMLGMYPMHLLSKAQWERIIPPEHRGGRLLDIGAGQGFVTLRAKDLFTEIVATETAPSMVERLQAKGIQAHGVDIAWHPEVFEAESFDVVSVLNVLDRCEQPLTLLDTALSYLKPGGLLILSDPLPFSQQVRDPRKQVREFLPTESKSFEAAFRVFYEEVIVPRGVELVLATRLPYVYKNTRANPYVALDDFLMVCRKPERPI